MIQKTFQTFLDKKYSFVNNLVVTLHNIINNKNHKIDCSTCLKCPPSKKCQGL